MHKNHIKTTCTSFVRRFDAKTSRINSRVLTTYSGTDASGQVLQTNFEAHTASGLPTRISDPEGRKTLLSYTSAGQLSQSTDRKGQNTTYTFDAADRLSQIKYAKSDATLIDQIDYTYDAAGQRISKTMLNGSVIAIAKADQSLEVGYAYSPYGQTSKVGVENQQAGSENNSQYTGRENDNNGLYYYRARYYDTVLKRFISEDPIGLAGGINSHAYVEGDPVSFTDPEGYARRGGNPYGSPYGRPGGVVIGGKLPPISPTSRQLTADKQLDLIRELLEEARKWPDLPKPFNEGCYLHCPKGDSCPVTYGNDRYLSRSGCILKCNPVFSAPPYKF